MTDWTVPNQSACLDPFWSMAFRRVALVLLVLTAVAACGQAVEPKLPQLLEGQVFPASMLELVSKRGDAPSSLNGKILVLNVWATWCPPCRHEMPGLDRLSKLLDPRRFAVIGVSVDADPLLAAEFLLQHGITFPNVQDINGKVARQMGLQAYPETFVLAPDRTLLRRISGQQEWGSSDMVNLLEGLYRAQRSGAPGLPEQVVLNSGAQVKAPPPRMDAP